jgi:hypothetical protein
MQMNATSRPFMKMVTTFEMDSRQIRMDLIAAVANVLRPLKSLNCKERACSRPPRQRELMQPFDTALGFAPRYIPGLNPPRGCA